MAPSLTTSAKDRAGVGFGTGYAAIDITDEYVLTNQSSSRGAALGIVKVDPCNT
jgi:hypothetical protein